MVAFWLNLDQISILSSTNPWLKMFINNLRVEKGFIQLKNLYSIQLKNLHSLQPVKPRGYENGERDEWMAGWTDGWVSGWIRMNTISNHTENSEYAPRQSTQCAPHIRTMESLFLLSNSAPVKESAPDTWAFVMPCLWLYFGWLVKFGKHSNPGHCEFNLPASTC